MKTVGQHLKNIRKIRKKSIKQLSEETKIKKSFISSIEKEKWNKLPDFPVVIGFVKSISNNLSLNTKNVVALLKRDYPPQKLNFNPKPEIPREFRWGPRLTFFTGVAIIIFFILGYLGYQYSQFIAPPFLEINSPAQDMFIVENFIIVSGKTEVNATIKVNDQPAYVDEEGNFYTEIDVVSELEIIEVTALSRSGKETNASVKVKISE